MSPRALLQDRDIFHTQGNASEVPQLKSWAEVDQGKHFYIAFVKVRLWTFNCIKLRVPYTVTFCSWLATHPRLHMYMLFHRQGLKGCAALHCSVTCFAIRKKELCKGIWASAGTEHIHYKSIGKERNWSHTVPPEFGIYAWSFGSGAVYCYLEPEGCSNPMESCGRDLSPVCMLLWYAPCSLNVQEISMFSP